jgi:hypothetical protein
MNYIHLKYCQTGGLLKEHLPGSTPIGEIQKTMND